MYVLPVKITDLNSGNPNEENSKTENYEAMKKLLILAPK